MYGKCSDLCPRWQILELVKGMHYQLACQKYFELTHNVSGAGVKRVTFSQTFDLKAQRETPNCCRPCHFLPVKTT